METAKGKVKIKKIGGNHDFSIQSTVHQFRTYGFMIPGWWQSCHTSIDLLPVEKGVASEDSRCCSGRGAPQTSGSSITTNLWKRTWYTIDGEQN